MPTFEVEAEGVVEHRVWGRFEVFAPTKEDAIERFNECHIPHEDRFDLVSGPEVIDEIESPIWEASDDN